MANKPPVGSLANWNPGSGSIDSDSKKSKLFSTEAHDAPDTMNATNEQKAFVGGKGTPKEPYGSKGKEF